MKRLAILLLLAMPLFANDIRVEPRTMQLNDLVTIVVTLEDSFAEVEGIGVPLENLALVGEPWVSSEFAWINGRVIRRKVFRYRARPLGSGKGIVGPVELIADDGQRETLPAVEVTIVPDRVAGSNDAAFVLRELLATRREPLFVIAEASKQSVYVGEPVDVTWWLYNAAVVQQWQLVNVPKLGEFWTEERNRNEAPERVYVGDVLMQRMAVRRVTLFPLQSGRLRIGGISVEAAVMRRTSNGPFAMFEGQLVDVTFTSAPVELDVQPIPPGPPVDAVGSFELRCDPAVQQNAGPIVQRVALIGLGNVRAATPPRYTAPFAGTLQIEGGEVQVMGDDAAFAMSRRWRYLIFPAQAGTMEIPPLSMRIFDPVLRMRRELRCGTAFINATVAKAPEAPAPPPPEPEQGRLWPWIAAALAIALASLVAIPRVRRELALRRLVREMVGEGDAAGIRTRIDERLQIDVREASDRGDAYRALRSLLDAAERDRDIAENQDREIARRVRELLRITR